MTRIIVVKAASVALFVFAPYATKAEAKMVLHDFSPRHSSVSKIGAQSFWISKDATGFFGIERAFQFVASHRGFNGLSNSKWDSGYKSTNGAGGERSSRQFAESGSKSNLLGTTKNGFRGQSRYRLTGFDVNESNRPNGSVFKGLGIDMDGARDFGANCFRGNTTRGGSAAGHGGLNLSSLAGVRNHPSSGGRHPSKRGGSKGGGKVTPQPDPGKEITIGSIVTGSPEPATFIVWSILGTCGIGLAWFRKLRSK